MSDVFTYELIEAMLEPGCERWSHFCAKACRHHAWLFHALAVEQRTGAPIADVSGRLLERDLERLRGALPGKRRQGALSRSATCLACAWAGAALEHKAPFFVSAVQDVTVRRRFVRSLGIGPGRGDG